MEFKKAVKQQSKLRCAIMGPSGSGKTYSSLAIAAGLGGKVALIDTEKGSASLYADRFDFDALELDDFSIETYLKAIDLAKKHKYNVLIIDSMSHAWESLLEQINQISKLKYKNNSWSAWSEGTPLQKKFINSILSYPGHVIASMRVKTQYVTESYDSKGFTKTKPVKVGLAPEQKANIDYEFTLVLEMNHENIATVVKDRTGKFQGKFIEKPGHEFGEQLIDWLNEGEPIKMATKKQIDHFNDLVKQLNIDDEKIKLGLRMSDVDSIEELTEEKLLMWSNKLQERVEKLSTTPTIAECQNDSSIENQKLSKEKT